MTARAAEGDLELGAPGAAGSGPRFPAIWLRDNCPCAQCLDTGRALSPHTGNPYRTRILHGRTAFTSAGGRHLQGCYADLDALASSLAVLDRQEAAA